MLNSGRAQVTCEYRCGNACAHEAPNPTDNAYLGDIVTVSRNIIRGNEIGRSAGYGWGGGMIIVGTESRIVLSYNIITDNIEDMIKKGMTLEQVKKANPTAGYRARWGRESGPWTTDMFVEAVYNGLKNPPAGS